MNNKISIIYTSVLLISVNTAIAHDTTHIHPLITAEIAELIEQADSSAGAYVDLYLLDPNPLPNIDPNTQRLYWGTDFDPVDLSAARDKQTYLLGNTFNRYARYNNVIDGVVQEDVPSSKVLNHFYQGTTGLKLTIPAPLATERSSLTAMKFFNASIDWISQYTEEAKATGYFVFGQALHHVEDMSSPAHVHNDPHLTDHDPERDDYEAYFLPMMKRAIGNGGEGDTLTAYFDNLGNPHPINNPWLDIWGDGNPASMVRFFHNATSFQGALAFPVADYDVLDAIFQVGGVNSKTVDSNTPAPTMAATGELAEMFPCNRGTNNPACLYWEEDNLIELAHWAIARAEDFVHTHIEALT